MKKILTLCTAFLLVMTGCDSGQVAQSPELTETVSPTPLVSESPTAVSPTPDIVPTSTADPQSFDTPPVETLPLPTDTPFIWDGNPDNLTLNDFPTQLSSGQQVVEAVPSLDPQDAALYLVCQLPDRDTWLYAACGPGEQQGLILRIGTEWRYHSIPFFSHQGFMPAMAYGDFDDDLQEELAIVPYLGGDTDCNIWGLYVVDFSDGGWDMLEFTPGDYAAILSLSVTCSNDPATNILTITAGDAQLALDMTALGFPDLGDQVVVSPGCLALFTTDGDSLYATFSLDLMAPSIPEGSLDEVAFLHAEVVYTGSAFGLNAPSLSLPEL